MVEPPRAVATGLLLAPDTTWLARCAPLFDLVDVFSVTPESTWRGKALAPNDYAAGFRQIAARRGRPMVGHGVGFSLASADASARQERWLPALARDHAAFDFQWYTEHLGLTVAAGEDLQIPLPVPHTTANAARVRASLDRLAAVMGTVGVENSAWTIHPGQPLDEPAWLADTLGDRHHLLLDIHNLYASAVNLVFDAEAWLARAPLHRVIELHLSGGDDAPASWGAGRRIRLDSHDHDVPNEVWSLFEAVLPHCPNLRCVTLERQEGTVQAGDTSLLAECIIRITETVA